MKMIKRMLLILIAILVILGISLFLFMQQEKFGKLPSAQRLERIKKSPNYKEGSFKNKSFTPDLTEGVGYWEVIKEMLFNRPDRITPVAKIPSVKNNLLQLPANKDVLVWFGHSSYYMQLDGKKILVDPVLSGAASPIAFTAKSFSGTDVYTVDDIPEIDYLFLSHDHWDHVDHETLLKLKNKVKKVICGLGTGEHLEHWGYDITKITEHDWDEEINLDSGFKAHTVTARHFSGRGFSRNKALWTSFVLETPGSRIFIGGDSGYDTHFAEAGKKFGTFDLVILENGQYDRKWKYIHMMPEEVLKAAADLNAKRLFPVHSSKFALANHTWDEPLRKITEYNKETNISLITPIIGEIVYLEDSTQTFTKWWENLK